MTEILHYRGETYNLDKYLDRHRYLGIKLILAGSGSKTLSIMDEQKRAYNELLKSHKFLVDNLHQPNCMELFDGFKRAVDLQEKLDGR